MPMCRGKNRYATETQAIRVAILRSREAGPLRAYRCPVCGKWHLTHKKYDPMIAKKGRRRGMDQKRKRKGGIRDNGEHEDGVRGT